MFKVGDKVLLNEKEFKGTEYKEYYEKWNGKPLTVKKIRKNSFLCVQTKEIINGADVWAEKELTLVREENEL